MVYVLLALSAVFPPPSVRHATGLPAGRFCGSCRCCLLAAFWVWCCCFAGAGGLVPVCRSQKLVEKPSPYFRFLLNQFSRLAFDLGGVRVHAAGLERVPREGRFLLVSNHLFAFDPIVFYYAMPWAELAFVSKTENFSLSTIVAQVMRKILCLPLDRNNDREALKAILKAIQFIKEDKASIAVFPEGGTSKSGLLQPFRNGAFKIAQKAGVPIVVCALTNTKAILKNMFRRRTDVNLDVLDVIPAETVASLKTTVEIGDYAHKISLRGLSEARRRYGAAVLKTKIRT